MTSANGEVSRARAADCLTIILAILLSAVALAYFPALDHHLFSSRYMSGIFRYLLKEYDAKTAWLTFGICVAAACWRNPAPSLKIVDFVNAHLVPIVIASVALLALGTVFVYHDNAFAMDEYAEVFQAKTFAAAQLRAHLPATVVDWLVPPELNGAFLAASKVSGEAIEVFWPGFPLMLAPFEALGIPWLCNPCLAGVAVFLIHRITLDVTGNRRAAGWAVLFTLASGAFVAYAISYYSMQARLTTNLLFAWLLLKPDPRRSFAAGIVGSLALVVHSPFPHALFAAPWILSMAFSKERRRSLPILIAGYLPLLIIVGVGWLRLRGAITGGQPDLQPITATISGVLKLPTIFMLDLRAAATVKMWIWAVPGLFLLALLGRLRCGDDYRVRLLTWSAVLTFGGYFFVVFDQGHGWGYRYLHSAWGVVPILAGCAMIERPGSTGRLIAFAGAAAMLSLLLVVPYQLLQIDSVIDRHLAQLPAPQRPGRYVYFIKVRGGFYAADLVQMDPLLRQPDLLLFSRGPELDAKLRQQNWPGAILVERRGAIEQWNVGPASPSRSAGEPGPGRFEVTYASAAPTQAPDP
jgi:hypothetical protein